jgi:hypothetical protein
MVLPTFGSISISGINSCARFTDGNIGVNTTSPNYNVDINGTLKATTITVGIMLATTSISSGAVNATNSTITNLVVTSNTVTNVIATNMSSATLNLSGGCTVGTARITTSLLAIGNSNTVGNIFTTGGNVGISTSSPGYTLDVNGKLQVYNNINNMSQIILSNPNSGSDATSIFTMVTDQVSTFNIFKNSTTRTVDGGANTVTIRNDGGPLRLQSNTGMGIWVGSTGNVGINTTVPGSTLDIKGNVNWGLTRLAPTTSGGETAIGFFALNDFTASTQATSGNWLLGTGINSGGASNFNLFRNTTNILSVATNGNVGIGTTSPSSKLNVSGSTDLFGNLRVGGSSSSTGFNIDLGTSGAVDSFRSGYLYGDGTTIYLTNQQNGALNFGTNNTWNRLVITAAGNVGINTNSPTYRFSVSGAGGFTGNLYVNHGGAGNTPQINVSPNTNTAESSIGFWQNTNNSGALWAIGHNPSGVGNNNFGIYSSTYGGNALSILNNGNVGINTNSPTEKLNVAGNTDIFGTLRVGGSSSSSAFLVNFGTAGGGTYRSAYLYGDGTNIELFNHQNGSITFATNNINRMRIGADGRVGIGINTPANNGLQINSGELQLGPTNSNAFHIYAASGGCEFYSGSWGAGTALGRWTVTGLGLGTFSPSCALDIVNATGSSNKPFLRLANSVGGVGNQVGIILSPYSARAGGNSSQIIAIDDGAASSNLLFYTAEPGATTTSTERMRIRSNGNIGIGLTSPIVALHVKGNVNSTGQPLILENYSAASSVYWKIGPDGGNNNITVYNQNNLGVWMANDGTGWNAQSDIRVKKDVETLTSGLDVVDQLRPVKYRYNQDDAEKSLRIGFIAQEVRDLIPEIVGSNPTEDFPDGLLGLSLESFVPFLVNAIKDLSRELQQTKQTVNDLLQRIQALENVRN